MISFDQVLLLEERVESAVKRIEQLNAENAALRTKIAELSSALNAKSEQFSSFQSNQSRIEEGILKALNRLNAVENVVIQSAAIPQQQTVQTPQSQPALSQPESVQNQPVNSEAAVSSQEVKAENPAQTPVEPVSIEEKANVQASEAAVQTAEANVQATETPAQPAEPAVQASSAQVSEVKAAPAQNPQVQPLVSEPSFDNMALSDNQPEIFDSSNGNPEANPLPEEVEIPVQHLNQTSDEGAQVSAESFSPDIAFDFGDSNPQQQAQAVSEAAVPGNPSEAGSTENKNQAENSEPQALFDIF